MYGRRRFYRRPARKYLRKRKATGKRSSVASRIKRYVKKEIHRNAENKELSTYANNQTIQTGDPTTETTALILSVAQGTSEQQRIGNQVKIVRGKIDMCINLLPYNATYNPNSQPIWVRVMVVRDLVNNYQASQIISNIYNNIFRAGSTTFTVGGSPLDIVANPNKDYVRVLYNKVFKLGQSNTFTNSPVNFTNSGYNDNSPMAKHFSINWGKWIKKQLKFTDGTNYPNNGNLYLWIHPVNADGTACTGKQMIEWHYQNTMVFEDL